MTEATTQTQAQAVAEIATANASRYLQQLCKHWSHKFVTEFDAAAGRIDFEGATMSLGAAAGTLTLTLAAADAGRVARMESVVADHLKRFAFREELVIDWRPG